MFISYTDIGLWASDTAGASWYSATRNGVPRQWVNTTYWMEFDPTVRGRMWAVMSGTHDLPRPKMWRRASPDSYTGGVVRSDDGGTHLASADQRHAADRRHPHSARSRGRALRDWLRQGRLQIRPTAETTGR